MINLLPWREEKRAHQRLLFFCLVLFLFSCSGAVITYSFFKLKIDIEALTKQKYFLTTDIARLNKEEKLNTIKNFQPDWLSQIHRVVHERFSYFKKLMTVLMRIKQPVFLVKLQCAQSLCDIDLMSRTLSGFTDEFKVDAIKREDTGTCYRAHVKIHL